MSRFGAMTDSDTSEKFGVGEALAVAGITIQLAEVLANIIKFFNGENNKERQSTVEVLLVSLMHIKDTINAGKHIIPPDTEKHVRNRLEVLVVRARKLEDRFSHRKVLQVVDVVKYGRFEKQVGKLRTGLADISSALKPYEVHYGGSHHQFGASHHQYYQSPCGFPMVDQRNPQMSAAPPQVVYNNYYISGARTANCDYADANSGRDQAHALNYGHNSGLAYNQPHVIAYPPVYQHR